MNDVKPMIAVMYSVHRHPKYDMTMNPPIKGANKGPMKTVAEKTATASPRRRLLNMSEKIAATTARGQDPKRPPKNRHIMIVCRSLATATAMEKMPNPKDPTKMGSRRP